MVFVVHLQALQLSPSKGIHMLHSNLSATYLQLGDKHQALQHAQQAVATAPRNFHMVCFITLLPCTCELLLSCLAVLSSQKAIPLSSAAAFCAAFCTFSDFPEFSEFSNFPNVPHFPHYSIFSILPISPNFPVGPSSCPKSRTDIIS
jgi:hypothetical protein